MLNTDIPSSPKISFQTYSIREQEAWMKAVPYMEKQVGRAFLLHTLLGTRISEILTLLLQRILFDAIICRIRKIKTSHF